LEQGVSLGQIAEKVFVGIQTSADEVFIVERLANRYFSQALGKPVEIEKDLVHPLLKGSVHIRRWIPHRTSKVVVFPYHRHSGKWSLISPQKMKADYPAAWNYLEQCRQILGRRERGTFDSEGWHGYVYPKNLGNMAIPKILTPSLARRAEFCLDAQGKYFFVGSGGGGGGGYGITFGRDVSMPYVLGLLNSRLLDWFLKQVSSKFHSGWFAYNKQYIEQIPIRLPQSPGEERIAQGVASRVERIIAAKVRLRGTALGDSERQRLEREVEAYEQEIDELVLRLYGIDKIPE
jgi:hypothetical protein